MWCRSHPWRDQRSSLHLNPLQNQRDTSANSQTIDIALATQKVHDVEIDDVSIGSGLQHATMLNDKVALRSPRRTVRI